MVVLFLPASRWARIRPVIPPDVLGYLFVWVLGSIVLSALLYQIGFSGAWGALRHNGKRFFYAIPMFATLFAFFTWKQFVAASILGVAILEFYYRNGTRKQVVKIVGVWAYLIGGIIVAIEFQAIVVRLRGFNTYDATLSRMDSILLLGGSVSGFSHSATTLIPIAEAIYYHMFAVIGIGIIFLCLSDSAVNALKMSNCILIAYILATVCFALWPSAGPFSLCSDHATHFPGTITLAEQEFALHSASALSPYSGTVANPSEYFISFPAMHVTIPLIVAWFLRKWKRVLIIVLSYTVLLVPAILILEWHYFSDILGGVGIALLAIWFVELAFKMRADSSISSSTTCDELEDVPTPVSS
jgi:hypothetical protein